MSVFVVVTDESIIAVLSSHNLAEQYVGSLTNWSLDDDTYQIQEHQVLTELNIAGRTPYEVAIFRDGSIKHCNVTHRFVDRLTPESVEEWPNLIRVRNKPTYIRVYLWARDEQEAIARSQPWRERYIREGRWTSDNNW